MQDSYDPHEEEVMRDLLESPDAEITSGAGERELRATNKMSDTVLELDAWSKIEGERFAKRLIGDMQHKEIEDKLDTVPVATDFRGASYEPNHKMATNPKNERLAKYMEDLVNTKEFNALHQETQLDAEASEIAATSFYLAWNKREEEREERNEDGNEESEVESSFADALCRSKSIANAAKDVDEFKQVRGTLNTFGSMKGDGSTVGKNEIAKHYRKIKSSAVLMDIFRRAGKYERFAMSAQRRKVVHGRDEITGIAFGNKFSDLLLSEKARLLDDDFSDMQTLKWLQKRTLVRERRSVVDAQKGPIVFCCDESGSMQGERIAEAKAIGLALAHVAIAKRRELWFVSFGTSDEKMTYKADNIGGSINWLSHFFGGGTEPDVPLIVVPENMREKKFPSESDIICVTDDCMYVPEEMKKNFLDFKSQTGTKFHLILVGGGSAESLGSVADTVCCTSRLGLDCEGVRNVLSI